MTWEDVFKLISAAVISFGGAAFIVRWFVNISANHLSEKMLRKYDAELNKDIERYKHELQLETEKYRQKTEKLVFVTRKQFETEFSAYQSLFDNLFDFSVCTRTLFPVFDMLPEGEMERKDEYKKRYQDFRLAFNTFSKVLEKNAPFIPENHYNMFDSIRTNAYELGSMYPEIRIVDDPIFREDYAKIVRENHKKTSEFNEKVVQAKKRIRDYLATLRIDQG
jgi:hypothetical protein